MTFQYEQRPEDFAAASRLLQHKVQYISFVSWLVLLGITLPAIRVAMAQGDAFSHALHEVVASKIGLILVTFLFPVALWLQPSFAARKIVTRPVEWTFQNEGIEVKTSVSSAHLRWDAFLKFREDRKVLLLYVQKGQAQFIPKRVLTVEQIRELRALILAHVPKA